MKTDPYHRIPSNFQLNKIIQTVSRSSLKWYTAILITLLSLLPQLQLWHARGLQWHGTYATVDGDEFLYSAYVNALIEGRPRRNDPFAGRNDNPNSPLPESTFSIQLIPPFIIASLARVVGLSASSAFIILIGAAGFLASLAVFWFLLNVTRDDRIAAVGTLFVLCFGGAVAGQGLLGVLLKQDVSTVGFPFLRRYQPAAAFFLFFIFCAFVWRALLADNLQRARLNSAVAGLTLGVLIFSYLYLWTAAVAWVICCGCLWLYFRPAERYKTIQVLAVLGGISLLALIPYLYLLSHRAQNLDETQTLIFTHRPDPFRIVEIIGALVLVLIFIGVRRSQLKTSDPIVIFTASLAILPFVLFNQQVVTGRSMQPFHFEIFIANYVVLVSLVFLIASFSRRLLSRTLFLIAILCLLWGIIEVGLPSKARYTTDVVNDEMIPVLQRLRQLGIHDGTMSNLQSQGNTPGVVFSPHSEVMRLLPTWTMQGTLLGLGRLDFGSASRKDRTVYTYLYYCGLDGPSLRDLFHNKSPDGFMNYYTVSAVFGHERVLRKLSLNFHPIEDAEIDEQVVAYETYVRSFSHEEALRHPITYVVVLRDSGFDFSRIDLWYERDVVEHVGSYDLYRLRLRT